MSSPKVLFGFHAVGVRLKTAPQSIVEIYFESTRRDARMRQLIEDNISLASTRRTVPIIVEANGERSADGGWALYLAAQQLNGHHIPRPLAVQHGRTHHRREQLLAGDPQQRAEGHLLRAATRAGAGGLPHGGRRDRRPLLRAADTHPRRAQETFMSDKPEPLPVVVRATETTESRAELYRVAGDRARALGWTPTMREYSPMRTSSANERATAVTS